MNNETPEDLREEQEEPYERTIRVSYAFRRILLGYLDPTERFIDHECPDGHAIVLYTPSGKKLNFIPDKEKSEQP